MRLFSALPWLTETVVWVLDASPRLQNTEIALKVKGQGQMSPKFNHFHRNTYSYQFRAVLFRFCADRQTDRRTDRRTEAAQYPLRSTQLARNAAQVNNRNDDAAYCARRALEMGFKNLGF